MKKTPLLLTLCLLFSFASMNALEPISKLSLKDGEIAYLVEDGEATIKDNLIKRIAVGRNKVTASYRNKGSKSKRPSYTLRLYNQYGLLLGEDNVGGSISFFGGVGSIDPDDVATEDIHIEWFPVDRIANKSKIKLPEDWNIVKWVVISESNTH